MTTSETLYVLFEENLKHTKWVFCWNPCFFVICIFKVVHTRNLTWPPSDFSFNSSQPRSNNLTQMETVDVTQQNKVIFDATVNKKYLIKTFLRASVQLLLQVPLLHPWLIIRLLLNCSHLNQLVENECFSWIFLNAKTKTEISVSH